MVMRTLSDAALSWMEINNSKLDGHIFFTAKFPRRPKIHLVVKSPTDSDIHSLTRSLNLPGNKFTRQSKTLSFSLHSPHCLHLCAIRKWLELRAIGIDKKRILISMQCLPRDTVVRLTVPEGWCADFRYDRMSHFNAEMKTKTKKFTRRPYAMLARPLPITSKLSKISLSRQLDVSERKQKNK